MFQLFYQILPVQELVEIFFNMIISSILSEKNINYFTNAVVSDNKLVITFCV